MRQGAGKSIRRLGSATLRVIDWNLADIDLIFHLTFVAHSVRWDVDGAVIQIILYGNLADHWLRVLGVIAVSM